MGSVFHHFNDPIEKSLDDSLGWVLGGGLRQTWQSCMVQNWMDVQPRLTQTENLYLLTEMCVTITRCCRRFKLHAHNWSSLNECDIENWFVYRICVQILQDKYKQSHALVCYNILVYVRQMFAVHMDVCKFKTLAAWGNAGKVATFFMHFYGSLHFLYVRSA